MNRKVIRTLEYFASYAFIGAVILFIFKCIFSLNYVPSASMENTIMTGDVIIGTRFNTDHINRYDIVVFYSPDSPTLSFVKRIIGLPGESIVVKNGKVYADGVELDDSFIAESMDDSGDGVYQVPENSYFVMGDNRNYSNDSRFWDNKYVSADSISSKAFADITLSHFAILTSKHENQDS